MSSRCDPASQDGLQLGAACPAARPGPGPGPGPACTAASRVESLRACVQAHKVYEVIGVMQDSGAAKHREGRCGCRCSSNLARPSPWIKGRRVQFRGAVCCGGWPACLPNHPTQHQARGAGGGGAGRGAARPSPVQRGGTHTGLWESKKKKLRTWAEHRSKSKAPLQYRELQLRPRTPPLPCIQDRGACACARRGPAQHNAC